MDAFARREDWFAPEVVEPGVRLAGRNRSTSTSSSGSTASTPTSRGTRRGQFDHYTDPAYTGRRLIMPMGGRADWATDAEIRHIRGLYAGEAELVDFALGQLFETLERLGYYDDSLILVLADHGHPLADHGKFLKGADRLYNELSRCPSCCVCPAGGAAVAGGGDGPVPRRAPDAARPDGAGARHTICTAARSAPVVEGHTSVVHRA